MTEQVYKEETENQNEGSSRRGFIRKLVGVVAAGGLAASILGRVTDKPLVQPAYGADNDAVLVGNTYTGTKETKIASSLSGGGNNAFYGEATGTSGSLTGVKGSSDSTSGSGVTGYAAALTGSTYGVYGQASSTSGTAVYGTETASSGTTIGVHGTANSTSGTGVYGYAASSGGIGVKGKAGNASATPIVAQAADSQTANIQEWQNSSGNALALVDENGNIGVNKSDPTARIDALNGSTNGIAIKGTANGASGGIGVQGHSMSSSGKGVWGTAGDATAIPIVAQGNSVQTANLQEWRNSDATALSVVDKDGKLGIGTATPSTVLHTLSDGGTASGLFDTYNNGNYSQFYFRRSRGTVASPSAIQLNDIIGRLIFTGRAATGFSGTRAAVTALAAENWTDTAQGTLLWLATTPIGSTVPAVTLAIDDAGRVGIGTTTPTDLLDVNSDLVRVRTAKTPASASAAGNQGEICWDSNYVYVCVATNTWKRAALASW